MFTGLIEEVGTLKSKTPKVLGVKLYFEAGKILDGIQIGNSISVNGVCLTTVEFDSKGFSVEAIEETLKKSNLGDLEIGDRVNLERPLKANARLGGHFVLGHVDTTGKVEEIKVLTNSHYVKFSYPKEFSKFLISVGSVAIDGVSMTVADLKDNTFSVGIIPHTWEETVFSKKKVGDMVNLEFDVLGKYVIKLTEENSK